MAKAEIMLGESDLENAPDFAETIYGAASSYTYTFLNDMDYVYFSFCRNDTTAWGTYSGSGTVTHIPGGDYNGMVKIENVKSDDTFVTPDFSISGSHRYIISVVGRKS